MVKPQENETPEDFLKESRKARAKYFLFNTWKDLWTTSAARNKTWHDLKGSNSEIRIFVLSKVR